MRCLNISVNNNGLIFIAKNRRRLLEKNRPYSMVHTNWILGCFVLSYFFKKYWFHTKFLSWNFNENIDMMWALLTKLQVRFSLYTSSFLMIFEITFESKQGLTEVVLIRSKKRMISYFRFSAKKLLEMYKVNSLDLI